MIGPTSVVGDLYDSCTTHYANHVAIQQGDRTITYRELRDKAYRLAHAFERMGVRKGERVAFLMVNCPEYIFTEYALAKLGAVRVPLAVLLHSNDLVYMMNHAECTTLVYHERLAPRVREMLPHLETVKRFVCVSADATAVPPGHLHLQTLMAECEPRAPEVAIDPEDLCGIYYTGGTTGRPKGVMLPHRAWVNSVLLEMLELGIERREVFAYLTPLTHAGGVLLLPVLLRDGTCLLFDHYDPGQFLAATEKNRITTAFFVPTMLYLLLDHPDLKKYDTRSLRNLIYGAAPIAAERLKQALDTFGPILTQLFGQTEAPMMISALSRDEHVVDDPERQKRILTSCGRPTATTRVRLVDLDDRDVPPGEVGEIIAQPMNMMAGYFKNPEATAKTLKDGWLHTGDLARADEFGYLYIVDRSKDMIVSGGFNVYPREIEDALFEHPAVQGAAVLGVPDPKWGEAVKAIVVLYPGKQVTEAELIEFVKARKGSLMAPKSVEFWEQIPVTNLGKLDKKKLREKFWAGHDRRVGG
ncbi:MAG: long-chain-fatty-acid--CoA ligase [Anaerolineae bacterium]